MSIGLSEFSGETSPKTSPSSTSKTVAFSIVNPSSDGTVIRSPELKPNIWVANQTVKPPTNNPAIANITKTELPRGLVLVNFVFGLIFLGFGATLASVGIPCKTLSTSD